MTIARRKRQVDGSLAKSLVLTTYDASDHYMVGPAELQGESLISFHGDTGTIHIVPIIYHIKP